MATALLPPPQAAPEPRRRWWAQLRRDRAGMTGLAVLSLIVVAAIVGPALTPDDQFQPNLQQTFLPPGHDHLLGTDQLGRDLLARVVAGARASLLGGLAALAVSLVLGVPAGLIAGYSGGRWDDVVMVAVEILMSFPGVLLAFLAIAGGRKIHAIEKALRITQALGPSYETMPSDGWMTFTPKPDYEGLPRLNLGVIRGGMTPAVLTWRSSLVPDYCEMIYDLRIVPGQSPESVLIDLRRLLDGLRAEDPDLRVDVELVQEHIYFPPFEVPRDSPIVPTMTAAHHEVFGHPPQVGALAPTKYAGADSAHMHAAGIPGVMYGPGGKYLSVPDERVEVENIVKASQVYALAVSRVWGMA